MEQLKIVPVLLGTDGNVYGMARSFHEAYGLHSVAIGCGRLGATANSRIVSVEVVEPRLHEDEVFCRTLIEFAGRYSPETPLLLIPCGDEYVRLLVNNQDALRPYYRFACPSPEVWQQLGSKETVYALCDRAELPVPQTATVTVNSGVNPALLPPFPVVVKPSNNLSYAACRFPRKKNVYVANTPEELCGIVDAIYESEYRDHLLVQEYLPGDDSHMRVVTCYCSADGEVRLLAPAQALLEEHAPDGIGNYAAVTPVEDRTLVRLCRSFLEGLGYHGFITFDFKLDPRDGVYRLLQVNMRQARCSYYVTAAGCNLAQYPVADLVLGEPADCDIAYGDVLWTLIPTSLLFEYIRDRELRERARHLIRRRRVCRPLRYRHDRSFQRWSYYHRRQAMYFKQYSRYFGKKGL